MLGIFASKQSQSATYKSRKKINKFAVKWLLIRRYVFYPLSAILICILLVRVFHTSWFPITTVEVVDPLERVQPRDLQAQVSSDLNEGFFRIDLAAIKNDVLTLPWVKHAQVARQWPNKIIITVEDRTPLAIWSKNSFIDTDGYIFKPSNIKLSTELPQFSGSDDMAAEIAKNYTVFNQILAPTKLKVKAITVSANASWLITLQDGMQINLGEKDLTKRLQRFVKVYGTIFASTQNKAQYVDMRYSSAMAVRWQKNMG